MHLTQTLREQMEKGWRSSKSLTGVTVVMLAAFFACLAGLALDGRIVTGAPVWLKPAKFAISSASIRGYAGLVASVPEGLAAFDAGSWRDYVRRPGD